MSGHEPYVPLHAPSAASADLCLVTARLVTTREHTDDFLSVPQALLERSPRRLRHVIVAATFAVGVVACAVASAVFSHGSHSIETSSSKSLETIELSSHKHGSRGEGEARCHTATKGERCYEDVMYQQSNIKKHPEWFGDLTVHSTFEEFQESLYKQERCPKPCTGASAMPAADDDTSSGAEEERGGKRTQLRTAGPSDGKCHTAVEGEKCLSAVKWVLKDGIFLKPEWYEGLTKMSRIEEVQAKLEKNDPSAECPRPCECHTAAEGDKCHKEVIWVLEEGISKHPEWYPGLSVTSRFEAVQARLHRDKKGDCPRPCTPLPYGSPSIFCLTCIRATGYEPEIMRNSNRRSIGIFACDEYAVYSQDRVHLGAGLVTITFVPAAVGESKDGTAGNAALFMNVWTSVKNDFRSKNLDWTVKVDPDALLLPDRLRQHISKHNTESVYVKNCGAYDAPGWPKLFGAVEIFSRRAMGAYFVGEQRCRTELKWYSWGEDLYMERCMDHLAVGNVIDLKVASDGACIKEPNCGDGWAAVFHPFKSWDKWHDCWEISTR